jgi:hypothetical protein
MVKLILFLTDGMEVGHVTSISDKNLLALGTKGQVTYREG